MAATLDRIAAAYGAAAVQAAFLQGGRVAQLYTYGMADKQTGERVTDDTVFRCASLSKLPVAMTILADAQHGGVSIREDVSVYLGFPLRAPGFPDTPVTLRMLLSHTAALQDGSAFLRSRNDFSSTPLRALLLDSGSFTGSRPGSRYQYSNFGVAVAAAALETVRGESFESLAQNTLFRPLNVHASFSAANLSGVPVAALYAPGGALQWSRARQMQDVPCAQPGQTHHIYQGNLTISACGYGRILEVLLQSGKSGGAAILSPDSVAQILSPVLSAGSFGYGLGIKTTTALLPGRTLWCHAGSNYGMYSAFAIDPARGTGAVIFTSGASAALDSSGIYNICAEMIRVQAEQAESFS